MAQIDPTRVERNFLFVWSVLLATQLIYVIVILSGVASTRDEPIDLPTLPIALAVVALATAFGAHLYWRRATGAGRPIHLNLPDPVTSAPSYILAWMFDESIAIYGLVLGLLGFSAAVWSPFSLAAFVLMLIHRPS